VSVDLKAIRERAERGPTNPVTEWMGHAAADRVALLERVRELEEALREIANMSCMEHDDDEHTEDCGVSVARRALKGEE
jgi:hypothetical protein